MGRRRKPKASPAKPPVVEDEEDRYFLNPDKVSIHLSCPVCQEPFRVPYRAPCGHSFCHSCISQWLSHSNTCPSDRKQLKLADMHHDFIVENIIGDQKVACPFRAGGCPFIGQLANLKSHKVQCTFNPTNIPECLRSMSTLLDPRLPQPGASPVTLKGPGMPSRTLVSTPISAATDAASFASSLPQANWKPAYHRSNPLTTQRSVNANAANEENTSSGPPAVSLNVSVSVSLQGSPSIPTSTDTAATAATAAGSGDMDPVALVMSGNVPDDSFAADVMAAVGDAFLLSTCSADQGGNSAQNLAPATESQSTQPTVAAASTSPPVSDTQSAPTSGDATEKAKASNPPAVQQPLAPINTNVIVEDYGDLEDSADNIDEDALPELNDPSLAMRLLATGGGRRDLLCTMFQKQQELREQRKRQAEQEEQDAAQARRSRQKKHRHNFRFNVD